MKSFWYRDYKSSAPRIEDISTNFVSGGVFGIDNERFRPQVNTSLSYFKSDWAGTHNFKVGGEFMLDRLNQPFRGFGDACNCVSVFNNTVPSQVYLYQSPVTSKTGLWAYTGYVNDAWQVQQPADAQPRHSPRPVSAVPPGADRTGGAELCRRRQHPRVEEHRSTPGRQLRRERQGQDRAEGQLRQVLAVPRRRLRQQHQPEPCDVAPDLHVARSEQQRPVGFGRATGFADVRDGRHGGDRLRSGHSKHVRAPGDGIRRARGSAEPRRPHRVRLERPASAHRLHEHQPAAQRLHRAGHDPGRRPGRKTQHRRRWRDAHGVQPGARVPDACRW